MGDPKVGPPLNRPALVREIQRHLKRIGCYRGDLTGVWTPAVREAMQAFTDRVNASLPIEQPDAVLLAMVQSHEPGVCSAACPAGQARAGSGRCVPSALVASADKESTPKAQARTEARKTAPPAAFVPARTGSAPAGVVERQPSPEGRMSLAGPPAPAPRQGRTARFAPARAATAQSATSYRSASARARGRYRTTQRPADTGLSGWLFPF
jgi:putative peptidoglycan binding protein